MTSGSLFLLNPITESPILILSLFPRPLLASVHLERVADDRHKIVNFEFKRKFKSIPVVSSFLGSAWNCQAQIHLESEGSDQGKMYVSRVNVKERPHASVVNATYVHLLPFFPPPLPLPTVHPTHYLPQLSLRYLAER
jgi:hypothetical protein